MNIAEIESSLKDLVETPFDADTFIFRFLEIYDAPVTREKIDRMLLDKLPEVLSPEQKLNKIHNLITSLSGKHIRNDGVRGKPKWVLIDRDS